MSGRICVHIGAHKTGTSTIQAGLTWNRATLKAAGWLVPLAGTIDRIGGHTHLALQLRPEQAGRPDALRLMRREIARSGLQQTLISSEAFWALPPEALRSLGQRLAGLDVVVIAYLRPQDAWLQSRWAQFSKSPHRAGKARDDFATWVGKVLDPAAGGAFEHRNIRQQADYLAKLEAWADVFGRDAIKVQVLERPGLQPNLFHHFLGVCGVLRAEGFVVPPDKNVTPGPKTLAVLRHLMPGFDAAFPGSPRLEHSPLKQLSSLTVQHALSRHWDREGANFIDGALHRRIMSHFEAANRTVARRYLAREELFLEPYAEKPVSRYHLGELSGGEALELGLFLLTNITSWVEAHPAVVATGSGPAPRPSADRDAPARTFAGRAFATLKRGLGRIGGK